jgi:hypothetical protein
MICPFAVGLSWRAFCAGLQDVARKVDEHAGRMADRHGLTHLDRRIRAETVRTARASASPFAAAASSAGASTPQPCSVWYSQTDTACGAAPVRPAWAAAHRNAARDAESRQRRPR